ncbi:response regulator [Paenibacillus sp. CF384]|uniref:response regulator transcription factor n=1 Tax=Paenibacillus sp. CF384 TaxID=1884382 RepID=UPI000894BA3F|nr:response regulator [Paenibacillus sp. CF384]SDX94177.1 two-component system, response regulator YesN [Paenibacillus sp. CF384]
MYKVLLVDDENLVLKSLAAGVDWKKSGFSVAGKANNATKALQLIQELQPHVVFTDIRMPGLSGLELIKQIKELDKDIQIIVISGYAEFAYVQKSLNYGVLGYCLKPFDDHEIHTLLQTAAGNLNEIKHKREGKLLELLDDPATAQAQSVFHDILSDAGVTSDAIYLLVTVGGKGRLTFLPETNYVGLNLGNSRSVYWVQSADRDTLLTAIQLPLQGGILGIGIQQSDRNLEGMMQRIEQCTVRAWDFFIHNRRDLYWEEQQTKEDTAALLIRRLERAVAKREFTLAVELLDEMCLPSNKQCFTIYHSLRVYNIVYFHSASHSSEDDYIFSKEQLHHLYPSFDQMIESLKESLNDELEGPSESVVSASRAVKGETEHANLKEIIKYMNENYRNHISIQSISRIFYLHPNYLSQLFKREIKVTFTEYLTKVRLQEAKNLLRTTNLPIGEVAETIGFRDYFYFTRIFKKNTQQTPKQYRMLSNGGGEA